MKFLFVLNVLLMVAAVVLGDIVLGVCAFTGLSGFSLYAGVKRSDKKVVALA